VCLLPFASHKLLSWWSERFNCGGLFACDIAPVHVCDDKSKQMRMAAHSLISSTEKRSGARVT